MSETRLRAVGLHPEQWKLEVERWFQIPLAVLELSPYHGLQAPQELDLSLVENTVSGSLRELCTRVKFHSADHTTMSVVGIAIIVVTALLLTAISYADVVLGLLPSKIQPQSMVTWLAKWEDDESLSLLHRADGGGPESRSTETVGPEEGEAFLKTNERAGGIDDPTRGDIR
jgi:hypothetical protein